MTVPGVSVTAVERVTWKRGGPDGAGIFAGMKKLFFLGACLLALGSSPVLAQTAASSTVETPAVAVVSIHHEAHNTSVTITGEGFKREDSSLMISDALKDISPDVQRAKVLRYVVAKLYGRGYVLKAGLGHEGVDDLIFVKEK